MAKKSTRSLVEKICRDLKFLRNDISVNGSKGLEAILRDHQEHFKRTDAKLAVINDCTLNLQSKRKLQKAIAEYFFPRPRLAIFFSFITSWKGFILLILGMSFVFNIVEPSIILKLITKLFP